MGIGKILKVIRAPQRKGEPSEIGLLVDSGEAALGVCGVRVRTLKDGWQKRGTAEEADEPSDRAVGLTGSHQGPCCPFPSVSRRSGLCRSSGTWSWDPHRDTQPLSFMPEEKRASDQAGLWAVLCLQPCGTGCFSPFLCGVGTSFLSHYSIQEQLPFPTHGK